MAERRSAWFAALTLMTIGAVGVVVTGLLASAATGSMMGGGPGQMMGGDPGQMMGQAFAGQSPATLTPAQATSLGNAAPTGATLDRAANQIRFAGRSVQLTVVASPDNGPDMTFRIAGLTDPTIIVPGGSTVNVRFVNGDHDTSHGWEVVAAGPPFPYMAMMGLPLAIGSAAAAPLGDATTTSWPAETISFTAGATGMYRYLCPVPGHAQRGMHGGFEVA